MDDAVSEITASGGTAIGVTADVTQQDEVTAAVERVTREFGAPQIVIGQTLFTRPGDFDDITDPEVYVESFRAYTMSTVYLLKAVLPGMKAAGWGRFVHVGSATAKEPERAIHHVVANGTRPSTIGLLEAIADEYAQYGVTVNTVAPGWIETENAIAYLDRQAGLTSHDERRGWMKDHARVPAARMGHPRGDRQHDRVPVLGPRGLRQRCLDRGRRRSPPQRVLVQQLTSSWRSVAGRGRPPEVWHAQPVAPSYLRRSQRMIRFHA